MATAGERFKASADRFRARYGTTMHRKNGAAAVIGILRELTDEEGLSLNPESSGINANEERPMMLDNLSPDVTLKAKEDLYPDGGDANGERYRVIYVRPYRIEGTVTYRKALLALNVKAQ